MTCHYIDASQEHDPHALPDVEVIHASGAYRCEDCGALRLDGPDDDGHGPDPERGTWEYVPGYYFAWLDGGLDAWSSEPKGPFDTEAEALKAAREQANCCEHGHAGECPSCDTALSAEDRNPGMIGGE